MSHVLLARKKLKAFRLAQMFTWESGLLPTLMALKILGNNKLFTKAYI